MKQKLSLLLIFIFALSASSYAETKTKENEPAPVFGIGIFGGFGFGMGTGHNQGMPASHKSEGMMDSPIYTGGVKIDYFLSESFSFNIGISYFHLEEKIKELDQNNSVIANTDFQFNYLKLPVSIRYGQIFFGGLGGYFSKQVGPLKQQQTGSPSCTANDSDISRIDYGLSLELGVLIPFSQTFKTEIALKIDWGLNKVVESSYQTLRNRTMYLTMGFLFF